MPYLRLKIILPDMTEEVRPKRYFHICACKLVAVPDEIKVITPKRFYQSSSGRVFVANKAEG